MRLLSRAVIPPKAGLNCALPQKQVLDSCFRGNDGDVVTGMTARELLGRRQWNYCNTAARSGCNALSCLSMPVYCNRFTYWRT